MILLSLVFSLSDFFFPVSLIAGVNQLLLSDPPFLSLCSLWVTLLIPFALATAYMLVTSYLYFQTITLFWALDVCACVCMYVQCRITAAL